MNTRAVAVGDSITRSGGAPVADNVPALSWAERVAEAMGWDLDTHAVSGYPVREVVRLIPPEGDYDVALTCVGTNDVLRPGQWSPDAYRADVDALLTRIEAISRETVVLGVIENVGSLPAPWPYGWGLRDRVETANRITAEVAAEHGALFVEPGRLSRPLEVYGDGVHPTSWGHILLANRVLAALGRDSIRVDFEPSADFLRVTRRRVLTDSIKRPPRGVAASLQAAVRRRP